MLSVLATAWRVVVKRAVSDRLILMAASVTIVLATSLLAAGPIYANAVALSGAQRVLADAPVREVNVEISIRTPPDAYGATTELVAAEVPQTFGLTGGTVLQSVTSGSYELPTQVSEQFTDLAVFQYLGFVAEHATIVAGRWPEDAGEPHETAISDSTAATLGLAVGDRLTVTNRADSSDRPSVEIVGVFSVDDPSEPYWYDDELIREGVVASRTFRTFGPFVVGLEPMLGGFSPLNSLVSWRVYPEYSNLDVSRLAEMRQRVSGLEDRLNGALERNLSFTVETRIPQILQSIERSVRATRTGVVTLTVQLAILAGYALLLTAGLLVENRRIETSLLRSRGASSRQVFAMALMEGVLLTVPAALVAPWLAALALRVLNHVGPLASIDLSISPEVTSSSYVLAVLAAIGCIAALSIPALRSARSFNESYVARGRQQARGYLQQGGIDLALLVFAALLFWQLRRFGAEITASVQSRLGIDPLLIAAPAIAMLAGAVLALRSIPLIARLSEKAASLGLSAVRALAAWQVSRRPRRHARAALLLIMAVGIGIFAAGYTTTWKRSQNDQADYQVGADVRIVPNRRINDSIPELNLYDAHSQIEGLEQSMPVNRESGQLSRELRSGRLLMLDATQAADVVTIREDLSSGAFGDLMGRLAAERPTLTTVAFPGEPRQIGVDFSVELDPLPEDFVKPEPIPESRIAFAPSARLVIQDGGGLLYRVDLGTVPVDAGRVRLVADLAHVMSNGRVATPRYPVSLVEIEIVSPAPFVIARTATVRVGGLYVREEAAGAAWQEVDAELAPGSWELDHTGLAPAITAPVAAFLDEPRPAELAFALDTGIGRGPLVLPVYYGLRPAQGDIPGELPVVVSTGFLESTGRAIGDDFDLIGLRGPVRTGRIVGTVAAFPTVDPDVAEVMVMDLPTVQMLSFETGGAIADIDERWIRVRPGETSAVAAELERAPYETPRVLDRVDRADTLRLDPVALGTIGSLSLGFVAAAVFAAAGFAVSAVVSARERLTEFALLRAVGLSPRQLGDWLSLEHGVLVLLSLVFGSAIGLLLIWIILPLIVITQDATQAVPGVIVVYPWSTMALLELVLAAALVAIVYVLVKALRRIGLGSLLRMGED